MALEPRSGAVTVLASSPGYDPNALASLHYREPLSAGDAHSLNNRATEFG